MTALADRLETELNGSLKAWPAAQSLVDGLRGVTSHWEHVDEPVKLREAVFTLVDEAATLSAHEAKALTSFFVDVFTSTPARPSEPNLRAVTDALPVLVSYVTGEERYGLVNRAYEEWFGIPSKDLIGKTLLEVIGESAYAVLSPHVKRGLAGERFTFEQLGVPYRLGGYRDVRVQFVPHLGPAGKNDGYVALLQDITEERALVTEREALLAREQAARTEAQAERQRVEELRQIAETANRAKDEFLAMLGHELRNPLAPISTALELMKLDGTGAFKKEREIIERQVDHLTRLVDDLLDVSRITSGKTEIERQRVDIADVVSRAIEIASPLIARRGHHVKVSLGDALAVDGDAVRLAQVVSNLLTNAAKYTEPGGHIEITAVRQDEQVVLSVDDDGIGIAPEMLPRVFELFSQAQQSLDRARGGLGLGLSIVRSLVALHGGSVRAESEGRGRGSRFTITLPYSTMSSPPVSLGHDERRRLAARGESKSILIVDDNVDAAELLSIALQRRGHTTRVAHDGPSALEVVDRFTPDVAVLDIGLPVMDGYALAKRLRSMDRLGRTRLIALTGYGQAQDRQRSAEAGFVAHMVKPVRIDELDSLFNVEPS